MRNLECSDFFWSTVDADIPTCSIRIYQKDAYSAAQGTSTWDLFHEHDIISDGPVQRLTDGYRVGNPDIPIDLSKEPASQRIKKLSKMLSSVMTLLYAGAESMGPPLLGSDEDQMSASMVAFQKKRRLTLPSATSWGPLENLFCIPKCLAS